MKLQEVKKYFENAEKCISTQGNEFYITEEMIEGIQNSGGDFYTTDGEFSLWDEELGFAKILTTKEKTFSITKDQILKLENGFTTENLYKWFPEAFAVKLEVGSWKVV